MKNGNLNLNDFEKELSQRAIPFREGESDLPRLAEELSRARIVMIGESTQGTREFYRFRRLLSSQLIERFGFRFVAFDGDWGSGMIVNDYVTGASERSYRSVLPHRTSREVLQSLSSWPICPLRNIEVELFLERLRDSNELLNPAVKAEVYGLDVYSLFESAKIIETQIQGMNPGLARELRKRYSELVSRTPSSRKKGCLLQYPEECEEAVIEELKKFARRKSTFEPPRTHFKDLAEAYYRTLMYDTDHAWELRDRHLLDTLEALLKKEKDSKCIVWAPNSRIVNHPSTLRREATLGGMAKEKFGSDAVSLIGLSTYQGRFAVSREWGAAEEITDLPAFPEDGLEAIFHRIAKAKGVDTLYVSPGDHPGREWELESALKSKVAIQEFGAIYHPGGKSAAFEASFAEGFDGFLFMDRTTPVEIIQSYTPQAEQSSSSAISSASLIAARSSSAPAPEARP